MFLKSQLFDLGWVIGGGLAVIGTIALLEWAGERRNRHAKKPAPDDGVRRNLIVHARSASLRLDRMLDLLQDDRWERGPTESASQRTFVI